MSTETQTQESYRAWETYVRDVIAEIEKRGHTFGVVYLDHLKASYGVLTAEQFAIEAIVRNAAAMKALEEATNTPEKLAKFQAEAFAKQLDDDAAHGFTRD